MNNKFDYEVIKNKAIEGDIIAQKRFGLYLINTNDNLEKGIMWLKKAAENDIDAMYILGKIYLISVNNTIEALRWFEKAANKNHINSMINIGAIYLFGYNVERDITKAIEWYKKAAKLESPMAIHNLGFIAFQDENLYDTALDFFARASRLGYADSSYMLGVMYGLGIGVDKNMKKTLEYLTLSFEQGKHYAARPIGDFYFQGAFNNGVQNINKAIEWYSKGVSKKVVSCIEAMGFLYMNGFGVEIDKDLAYDYYKLAVKYGSVEALSSMGLILLEDKKDINKLKQALKYFLMAEKKGETRNRKVIDALIDVIESFERNSSANKHLSNTSQSTNLSFSNDFMNRIQNEIRLEEQRKKEEQANDGIFAAAGMMNGSGSIVNKNLGIVIGPDGEASFVDTKHGIILSSDGSVSTHDTKSGITYNWSTGSTVLYNDTLKGSIDLKSGNVSYKIGDYIW